jgi:hypothetical protein
MATVTYRQSSGEERQLTFTADNNPLVTPGEVTQILQQLSPPASCSGCTFTFDRFNSAQTFTFDELLAWKNQAGVRLNQPLGGNGVIVNAPAGEKFPAGSRIVLQHQEDGAVEGEPVLLTMARSWAKLLPPTHQFSKAGTYSVRLYGPGKTVTSGQLGGKEIGVIQVGSVQAVVTPVQAPPPQQAVAAQPVTQPGDYKVGVPIGGSGIVVKKDSGKWPAETKLEIFVDGQLKDTHILAMARSWVRFYQATDAFDQAGTYSIRIQDKEVKTFVVDPEAGALVIPPPVQAVFVDIASKGWTKDNLRHVAYAASVAMRLAFKAQDGAQAHTILAFCEEVKSRAEGESTTLNRKFYEFLTYVASLALELARNLKDRALTDLGFAFIQEVKKSGEDRGLTNPQFYEQLAIAAGMMAQVADKEENKDWTREVWAWAQDVRLKAETANEGGGQTTGGYYRWMAYAGKYVVRTAIRSRDLVLGREVWGMARQQMASAIQRRQLHKYFFENIMATLSAVAELALGAKDQVLAMEAQILAMQAKGEAEAISKEGLEIGGDFYFYLAKLGAHNAETAYRTKDTALAGKGLNFYKDILSSAQTRKKTSVGFYGWMAENLDWLSWLARQERDSRLILEIFSLAKQLQQQAETAEGGKGQTDQWLYSHLVEVAGQVADHARTIKDKSLAFSALTFAQDLQQSGVGKGQTDYRYFEQLAYTMGMVAESAKDAKDLTLATAALEFGEGVKKDAEAADEGKGQTNAEFYKWLAYGAGHVKVAAKQAKDEDLTKQVEVFERECLSKKKKLSQ